MTKPYKKIAITTGDANGIGWEITAKALVELPPSAKINKSIFVLFRSRNQEKLQSRYFRMLDKVWARYSFESLESALVFLNSSKTIPDNVLIDLSLSDSPARWVYEAALACKHGLLDSIVTGPLSKKTTAAFKKGVLGHTGIFRVLFPKKDLFMGFAGRDFNVLLATDHISVSSVEHKLTRRYLISACKAALEFRKILGSEKPVGVLGLNPHAGEGGLIGKFEKSLFSKLQLPRYVDGPLVPDAAFLKTNWNKYSVYVCLYHDQGLIPFKLHHGQESGVHVTVGLPFVRTSVDHGTATDLFNKNVANYHSMLEAITLNMKLIRSL